MTCPFCRIDGNWGSFMKDFFIACSSTCVTGLSVYGEGIVNVYNLGGQIVMLVMIQIGGLSFITLLTFVVTLFTRRISMRNRLFLSQAVSATSLGDMTRFVRNVVIITFSIEFIGAVLLLPVFIGAYDDIGDAIWTSIFQSVSTFCNAGFDILGSTSYVREGNEILSSLADWQYYYMQAVTMILVIFGGISFLVIMDIFSPKKNRRNKVLNKVVLSTTLVLLVGGTGLLCLTEIAFGDNDATFMQCLFQSVTCRTAGFSTMDQSQLSTGGKVISCILMFIGGSPTSTAGGIKTTTIFVIIYSIYRTLRGKQFVAFNRRFSYRSTARAMSLVVIGGILILVGYICIVEFEAHNEMVSSGDAIYEVFSAFGTVGLSSGITPYLTTGSEIVLCVLMLFGRIGPVTFFQIFNRDLDKEEHLHYEYVEEDILIG